VIAAVPIKPHLGQPCSPLIAIETPPDALSTTTAIDAADTIL